MEGQLFGEESPAEGAQGAGGGGGPDPDAPLAVRMRPRALGEVTGQEHLLAEGSALRTAIETGTPHSMILYGPPGTGKTTLARLVAAAAGWAFEEESAVNAGRAEVRAVIARAGERRKGGGRPTVFFLDEIHRFNKAQQDALLPAVEDGLITLIGATTENPYFEVNSALLSRCQIYELKALEGERIEALLRTALTDPGRGVGPSPPISDDALALLAERSGGDARTALGALERAVTTARASGAAEIGVAAAEDTLQRKAVGYDKGGDRHYDYISAWIKATRGSDPDASLYYLAAMLEGGEDPRFIARRMVILASEDVGNADPQALLVATAAAQAVDRVGLPECRINLAQAAAYLSLAPKSNASYKALGAATGHIRRHGAADPPPYLQDSHYAGAEQLGRGIGYEYSHDAPDAVAAQPLAPEEVRGEGFFEPTDRGWEARAAERLARIRASKREES
jgi:putative ATPase